MFWWYSTRRQDFLRTGLLIGIIWLTLYTYQLYYFYRTDVRQYQQKQYSYLNHKFYERILCFFINNKYCLRQPKTLSSIYDRNLSNILREQPLLYQYAIAPHFINFKSLLKTFIPRINKQYLVYVCDRPCGGWGDRTRKIVGAYLLSLALNRTFIINITWPCPILDIFEPNIIKWNSKIYQNNKSTNLTVLTLSATDNDYREVLSWKSYDIIYFKTKDLGYYSMLLWRDDLYQRLQYYGFQRSTLFIHSVFTLIYELLFKLKKHPKNHIDDIVHNYELNNERTNLFCAHIRIGRNPSNPNDNIFPKREKMNITVINFLRKQLNDQCNNKTLSSLCNYTKIFVTTDSEQVQTYVQKQFGKHLLNIEGLIRHIDRAAQKVACESLEKTILDFQMISYCNSMIMSKSAFSFWSNVRRLKPYEKTYIYCDGIKSIRRAGDYEKYPYGSC